MEITQQHKKIGEFIYAAVLAVKNEKAPDTPMQRFLPEGLRSSFYKWSRGQGFGQSCLDHLGEIDPVLPVCLDFSDPKKPKLSAQGKKHLVVLQKAGMPAPRVYGSAKVEPVIIHKRGETVRVEEPQRSPAALGFELGCTLNVLGRQPAASSFLEVLEKAMNIGLSLSDVVKAVRSGGARG